MFGKVREVWRRRPADGARVYCTYFDSAYLARGVAMLRSLRRQQASAGIVVLALDEDCERVLRDTFGDGVQVIEPEVLHARTPELRRIRGERSAWAYYATQKPVLALYAMESAPRPAAVMYVDADGWFCGDPGEVFAEMGGASVALSPHRFTPSLAHLAKYGVYNAGCIFWRNDETGRRCLEDWRDDCLEWCGEQAEADGRFMNQGYLSRWPERYEGVHAIGHPGLNLAPWNIDGHELAWDGEGVTVDGRPLIFYHFTGIGRDAEGRWHSYYARFERQFEFACERIYRPYMAAVDAEIRRLRERYGMEGIGSGRAGADWSAAFEFGRTGAE